MVKEPYSYVYIRNLINYERRVVVRIGKADKLLTFTEVPMER